MADSAIEEIKRRLDPVDVIGQTVQLKRAGRSFKGLCPFHSEKSPSFVVSPERGTWHCFGCSEGGDIFSFVQRRDNLDFPEALRLLAARAGVEVERISRPDPGVREQRDRLHALVEAAALFYRSALTSSDGGRARAYLDGRGLVDATVERFGLGYADPSGRTLERHLLKAGFPVDDAVAVGALGRSEEGRTYDRFRDRVIFPIRDGDGRAIGFGGRAMRDDQQPKYLNSPQSELFDKGANLYALDQAAGPIREARRAIVVEGYMDALIAHQHGFANVVATLGTAIGERHIQTLRRLAPEIVLALDADPAGVKAALRGSDVASDTTADESPTILRVRGLGRFFADRRTEIKVMLLPAGRDPDDVIRADPALWARLASQALPIVDFVLHGLAQRHDLSASAGQREAAREAMTVIQDLPDPIERAHYIQRLARILNTREEFLLQAAGTRPRRQAAVEAPVAEPPRSQGEQLGDLVLALLLRAPSDATRPEAADFESAEHRAVYERLGRLAPPSNADAALDWLAHELGATFAPTLVRLRAAYDENERLTLDEASKELHVRTLELRKQRLFRQHQALDSALREDADRLSAAERRAYEERLAALAAHLGALFVEQQRLGVVGSASWSVRRGHEVLSPEVVSG
ncbi:MAG: DNA primase [Chloroflexi bacterium]|nr:DNA primase [Chloroflexota bacterium]